MSQHSPAAFPMTVTTQALLEKLFIEHRTQVRHTEAMRSTVLTILASLTFALTAVVSKDVINMSDLPFGGLIFGIGIFGIVLTAKMHEKLRKEMSRADACLDFIDVLTPGQPLKSIYEGVENEHARKFSVMIHLKMYLVWGGLAGMISVVGLAIVLAAAQHSSPKPSLSGPPARSPAAKAPLRYPRPATALPPNTTCCRPCGVNRP